MVYLFIGYALMLGLLILTFRANVRILKAAEALYYSGHWVQTGCLRLSEEDQQKLWENFRDACCFEPGHAPNPWKHKP